MSAEQEPDMSTEIKIAHSDDDYLLVAMGLADAQILKESSLTLEAIRQFCGPCDYFKETDPCTLVGREDQTRYVNRKWCGWAMKDGERVIMTAKGTE